MAITRYVYKTRKDQDGDIMALCNDHADWSPRSKASAMSDIESGLYEYFAKHADAPNASKIIVVDGPTGKYLRNSPDGDSRNNLDNLPDC